MGRYPGVGPMIERERFVLILPDRAVSKQRGAALAHMRLSVLTWNLLSDSLVNPIWHGSSKPEDIDPVRRWGRLLRRLRALEADLFCLQEVQGHRLVELAGAFPEHQWRHAPHGGHGVAIGFRGRVDAVEAVEVGAKRALVADVGGLRVACVHLSWTGPPVGGRRRGLEQLEAVLALEPDVVAGDFNALPDWPESERLRRAGLVPTGAPGPTCNANRWLQRLDEVWIRAGEVLDRRSLPPITEATPMPSATHPSDHLPLGVDLDVVPAPRQRRLWSGQLFA